MAFSNRGFTLVELLLVITIMAIITIMGANNLGQNVKNQALTKSQLQVKAALNQTRSYALYGKKPSGCTGTFQSVSFHYQSNFFTIQANCSGPTTHVIESATLDTGITFQSSGQIIFTALEGSVSDGTTKTFGLSKGFGSPYTITVHPNGTYNQ